MTSITIWDEMPSNPPDHADCFSSSVTSVSTATDELPQVEGIAEGAVEETTRSAPPLHLSYVLFFLGSFCYLISAIWDLVDYYEDLEEYDEDYYDEDEDYYDNCKITHPPLSVYLIISILGSSCYLVDALFSSAGVHGHFSDGMDTELSKERVLHCGVRFFFGVGASLDVLVALLDDPECPTWQFRCAVGAVYSYLIFAILVLSSRNTKFFADGQRLVSFGDLLFLMGSLIDVFDSFYWNTSTSTDSWRIADYGNLISSSLWFIDSILYILAEYGWNGVLRLITCTRLDEKEAGYELIATLDAGISTL